MNVSVVPAGVFCCIVPVHTVYMVIGKENIPMLVASKTLNFDGKPAQIT